jgi:DNA repair protein RecN (Recombination protein N)
MLLELRVQNLLLIESAELVLDRGLNVITGETGAGKTMLAHALDLLLGGKPKRSIVRPGAEEAYVEGVFSASPALLEDPELAELAERLPLDADELVLARRVTAAGRTRAYLQGRSVTAAELAAVAGRLVAFFGQHEHRRLVLASAQLEILDAYCGEEQLTRRRSFE